MTFRLYAIFFICLSFFSFQAHAEPEQNIFTGTEFLSWERDNQEFYIRTSIGMAVLIVDQYDASKGKCVSDMFSSDENGTYDYIMDTMKRFPEYHPRGTILAVLEKKCGKFKS